jgi:hypothetical protein
VSVCRFVYPPPAPSSCKVGQLGRLLGLASTVILDSESRRTHEDISLTDDPGSRATPSWKAEVVLFGADLKENTASNSWTRHFYALRVVLKHVRDKFFPELLFK